MLAFLLRVVGYLILMAIAFVPAGVVHFFLRTDVPTEPKESLIFTIPYLDYEVIYANLKMDAYGDAYFITLAYVVVLWLAVGWIRLKRKAV
ncbi:hypothetical protein ACFLT7_02150 [candidate division KSB1 bacterium]